YRHDDGYVILSITGQTLKGVKHIMAVNRPGCLAILGQVPYSPDAVEIQVLYMSGKQRTGIPDWQERDASRLIHRIIQKGLQLGNGAGNIWIHINVVLHRVNIDCGAVEGILER